MADLADNVLQILIQNSRRSSIPYETLMSVVSSRKEHPYTAAAIALIEKESFDVSGFRLFRVEYDYHWARYWFIKDGTEEEKPDWFAIDVVPEGTGYLARPIGRKDGKLKHAGSIAEAVVASSQEKVVLNERTEKR